MAEPQLERPDTYVPTVTPRADAPEAYVECGNRYWDWKGLRSSSTGDPASVTSVWNETAKDIAQDLGEPAGRLYLFAAAGVEAVLAHVECDACGQPVALKSRTTLDDLVREGPGHRASQCARCDSRLQDEVSRVLDPARAAARAERRRAAAERQAEQDALLERRRELAAAARQLEQERRTAVAAAYPITMTAPEDVDWSSFRSRLRTEMGTLAILDYSPQSPSIPSVLKWDIPLGPSDEITRETLVASFHAGFLRIHPNSRLDGFVWVDDSSAELADSFFPVRVDWYCGLGTSFGTAAEALQAWLRDRTQLWLTTEQGVDDVARLARDLIVAESLRYLDDQLAAHNLPGIPENHQARLCEAAERLAESHSLGQCYAIAWRAARNAASMARRHPRAPETSATAHAVNSFEHMAATAIAAFDSELQHYREDSRTPLSAITRTLFIRVLDVDPMATSAPTIEQSLRSADDYPRPGSMMFTRLEPSDSGGDTAWLDAQGLPVDPTSPSLLAHFLAEALSRLERESISDLGVIDEWLLAGYEPTLDEYRLSDVCRPSIADGFDRLTALRAGLNEFAPIDVAKIILAVAYLLPGTVHTVGGDELAVGQVIGDELLHAIRKLNAD